MGAPCARHPIHAELHCELVLRQPQEVVRRELLHELGLERSRIVRAHETLAAAKAELGRLEDVREE